MIIKNEIVTLTNSKPHGSSTIRLQLRWDTRVGEYAFRNFYLERNNLSLEVLEEMVKILKSKLKEKSK